MEHFKAILKALANRHTAIGATEPCINTSNAIHRAYADLVGHAFLYIRSCIESDTSAEEIHDLADSLHNVSGILNNYGSWVDDDKYRRLYIQRFDAKWANDGFGIEWFLNERIAYYSKPNEDNGE